MEQPRASIEGGHDTRSFSIDSDRRRIIHESLNPNQIVTYAPKESFKLGYFDVLCLVVNFMIGTGVFNSHTRVLEGTDSIGASMLLWLAGIIYCLCGTFVYIEYGLNAPRYFINGVEQSVPRSGGDLNYLQFVFRRPAYRKNTVLMSICIFGICFITFGNMAGNAIKFSTGLLRAVGIKNPGNGPVRGMSIAVSLLTCFIHAFSRRGGIYLNNMFAMIKIAMLILIIVIAIMVAANAMPETHNVFMENVDSKKAFKLKNADANGYARAFLAVIFSFWGYEQPTNVLGEIARPHRKFPIGMGSGVALVCLLYMSVTLSYLVVVPKDVQMNGEGGVAQQFFAMTLGRRGDSDLGERIFNAFIAISSFGNMIVMTYTASRVKQEIAKEGFLPWARFFAQNTDLSFGRLLNWLGNKGLFARLLQVKWLAPAHHSEKTPVGAFVLHFASCLVLICVTWRMTPDEAYELLANLAVYVINCFFGIWIGLGILILRLKGPPKTAMPDGRDDLASEKRTWRDMTGRRIHSGLSVFCATYFTICNIWPIVMCWIPPNASARSSLTWWLVPTVAWSIIGLGTLWYLGFLSYANILRKDRTVFTVEKRPEFESMDPSNSETGYVLVHETTYLSWIAKETLEGQMDTSSQDEFEYLKREEHTGSGVFNDYLKRE
ncbi:High-affinity methionine permease [Paramyrothecium foliicola]|nr:High-affinity methionine permease [Paramyrothecium foliicola]